MEPRIQYVKTEDGVSIAYATIGEGPTVMHMPTLTASHIGLMWRGLPYQTCFRRLARDLKLVTYDPRGCGLSDRDISDRSRVRRGRRVAGMNGQFHTLIRGYYRATTVGVPSGGRSDR